MKKKFKSNFPVIAIAAAIVICLVLTGIILSVYLNKDTAVTAPNDTYLQNAYITFSSDGRINFICDGESYEYDGVLASEYTGIADIAFEDGKITKIYTKSASVSGTLLAYTDNTLRISGYGTCSRNESLACYVMQADGSLTTGNFSDCIVGATEAEFVFENGIICAVIAQETESIENISVLLKNGDSIYRDNVFVTADANFSVNSYAEAASDNNISQDNSDVSDNSTLDDSGNDAQDVFAAGSSDGIISVSDIFYEYSLSDCEISCADGLLYFCDSDGNITSEGYEGTFHIMQTDDGFVVVNTLPLEDYVRYVLPSEMPASFSFESLKAQAVCARTFACAQIKNNIYAQYGANLDDSTSYQVYNASGSNETMDKAVADTAGEVLTCDGELITCYYYSTSPGFTTTTSVWGSTDSPSYLMRRNCLLDGIADTITDSTDNTADSGTDSTDDAGDENTDSANNTDDTSDADTDNADALAKYDLSDESTLQAFLLSQPDSYDSSSPFYRWTATLNLANITDDSLGMLTSIKVISRNESGYVTELECTFEKGTKTLTNENIIRRFLGAGLKELILSDGTTRDFTTIPSACFCITATDGYKVTLSGGGFGHGVGMSQYGADAMGDAGWSYEEILMFYYNNISIMSGES